MCLDSDNVIYTYVGILGIIYFKTLTRFFQM